ncbi:ATP-binding protein [Glycomyces sp. NPDC047369]
MATAAEQASGVSELIGELRLAALPGSVGSARDMVRSVLGAWDLSRPPQLVENAQLVASELVAHAVESQSSSPRQLQTFVEFHGRRVGMIVLRMRMESRSLLVEVWDDRTEPPAIPDPPSEENDRVEGLGVGSVSKAWDYYLPGSGGRVVWAELHLPHSRSTATMGES